MAKCAWLVIVAGLLLSAPQPASAQVERIWLTHRTSDPSKLVVNWTSKSPGDSRVRFGPTAKYGEEVHVPGSRTLHHVEIPFAVTGGRRSSVSTAAEDPPDTVISGYPAEVLRVAVAVVPGLSDRLLSERLKELEAEGIVTRTVVPTDPGARRLCADRQGSGPQRGHRRGLGLGGIVAGRKRDADRFPKWVIPTVYPLLH